MDDGPEAGGVHFGLAQANDGRGDYAKAAENMVAANALQKQHFEDARQRLRPRREPRADAATPRRLHATEILPPREGGETISCICL